jgi:hypothetical protein
MNSVYVLHFSNLFFAGILAGMETAIHYGLHPATQAISDQSQFQLRQALVVRLRILVPAFFLPTAATGIAVVILDGTAPGLCFRGAAIVAVLVWIVTRVVGTVPINKASLTWQAGSPPADWKTQVDHAERFHVLGVWTALIAFASFLAAAALKLAAY